MYRKAEGTRSNVFAINLSSWATLCWQLGQHKQAEKLAREALPLVEEHFGKDSLSVAELLDTLALALIDQKRYTEAAPICQRALELSARHTSVRWSVLDTVGRLHQRQRQWKEAERYYRDALALARKEPAKNPADLAYSLNNLADVLAERGEYEQAAPLFAEAATTWEKDRSKHERDMVGALCDVVQSRLAAGDLAGYQRHCRELLRRVGASKDTWIAERVGRASHATGLRGCLERCRGADSATGQDLPARLPCHRCPCGRAVPGRPLRRGARSLATTKSKGPEPQRSGRPTPPRALRLPPEPPGCAASPDRPGTRPDSDEPVALLVGAIVRASMAEGSRSTPIPASNPKPAAKTVILSFCSTPLGTMWPTMSLTISRTKTQGGVAVPSSAAFLPTGSRRRVDAVTDSGALPQGMAVKATDGITESRGVLTGSLPSFFTKLFDKRVNRRASARGSIRVTLVPRTGRELNSPPVAKSP